MRHGFPFTSLMPQFNVSVVSCKWVFHCQRVKDKKFRIIFEAKVSLMVF